jgi:hypothetical protein
VSTELKEEAFEESLGGSIEEEAVAVEAMVVADEGSEDEAMPRGRCSPSSFPNLDPIPRISC